MSIKVVINPGSGPVAGSTEIHANENMKHFVADCGRADLKFIRVPHLDQGEGRFTYILWKGERCHEIEMPGLPLNRVRFTGDESQNIWDFPRLYVDGGSWVWKYAVLDNDCDWAEYVLDEV